jgi:collagenase-like PrtC family protease
MSRHGNRWNVNEVLSLQREYELLEMTVQEIAEKHQRSVMSIVNKLYAEGFTSSKLEARGFSSQPLKAVVSSPRKAVKRVVEDEDDDLASDDDTSSDFEDDYQDDDSEDEDYEDEDEFVSSNKSFKNKSSKMAEEMSEDVSEVDKLTERVWSLETNVGEIGTMVKSLFDKLVVNKSKKLQPLRKRVL